ncbi:hypothetical protein BUALT_Bualt10G0053300 [Buddleja alternifolia]|uniref:Uncharacterized protein n=1 Tax=Buddleja alternifolia TaxID=168488 RepID=A0AAV6X765_9LAMI|nr:hypothetical protein BUALT_Bualt10G0053300 [Buddleja alternifolia]
MTQILEDGVLTPSCLESYRENVAPLDETSFSKKCDCRLMDFMKNATKESHEEDRSSTTSAQLSTRIIAIADH